MGPEQVAVVYLGSAAAPVPCAGWGDPGTWPGTRSHPAAPCLGRSFCCLSRCTSPACKEHRAKIIAHDKIDTVSVLNATEVSVSRGAALAVLTVTALHSQAQSAALYKPRHWCRSQAPLKVSALVVNNTPILFVFAQRKDTFSTNRQWPTKTFAHKGLSVSQDQWRTLGTSPFVGH